MDRYSPRVAIVKSFNASLNSLGISFLQCDYLTPASGKISPMSRSPPQISRALEWHSDPIFEKFERYNSLWVFSARRSSYMYADEKQMMTLKS
jgi:hypothetical protein